MESMARKIRIEETDQVSWPIAAPRKTPHPLIVFCLRGNQREMGAQHGAMLLETGGYRGIEFYRTMTQRLMETGIPRPFQNRFTRLILQAAAAIARNRMARSRPPAYHERSVAFFRSLGEQSIYANGLLEMDAFQNLVALFMGIGQQSLARRTAAACAPACTSLMAWGATTIDGRMLHARNFDFPGIGVWDHAPAVVFCEPDDGLRYGFVTTRGADTPGVTAFNEAGISLTMQTRFHKDIRFSGWGIIDLGHEIIRRSRTLDDAVSIVSSVPILSTWGMAVSSAGEKRAVAIETNGKRVAVVTPGRDEPFLPCTNRYRSREMINGEITLSPAFVAQSDGRERRAMEFARQAGASGGCTENDLKGLLGDHLDPDNTAAAPRGAGNMVSQALTVQSVVFDPENGCLHVSSGPAPTGWGPYESIPWQWDSGTGFDTVAATPRPVEENTPQPLTCGLDEASRPAYRAYVEACRVEINGADESTVREHLGRALSLAPEDPSYRFLDAAYRLCDGDLEGGRSQLRTALEHETVPFRRGQILLWMSRACDGLGRKEEAGRHRRELLTLDDPRLGEAKQEAEREARRPFGKWRFRFLAPNLMLVDLH